MAQARQALGQQGGVSGSQSISLLSQLDTGARSAKPGAQGAAAGPGDVGPGSGAGPVLQFFTRLRRHASLDGASPYFKVKKWKLEPSQRASSLDTRGKLQPLVGSEAQGDVEQQPALHRWGGGGWSPVPIPDWPASSAHQWASGPQAGQEGDLGLHTVPQ